MAEERVERAMSVAAPCDEQKKMGAEAPIQTVLPESASILPALSKIFELPPLAIELLLVPIDLLILLRRLVITALQLVTDQRAGAESQSRADDSARAWMTHCRADDTARRRASERADAGTFFAGGQRTARAPGDQCACQPNDGHATG